MSDTAAALIAERRQLDDDFAAKKIGPFRYVHEAGRIQRRWDALPASERN